MNSKTKLGCVFVQLNRSFILVLVVVGNKGEINCHSLDKSVPKLLNFSYGVYCLYAQTPLSFLIYVINGLPCYFRANNGIV